MKFTQEIKDAWVTALKSGKYKQVQKMYQEYEDDSRTSKVTGHCCLAVLDDVVDSTGKHADWESLPIDYDVLVALNDQKTRYFVPNYSNVLPLIESLQVEVEE